MKQRDLELLSSYLDGQLSPSDSARLERRLASDQNLRLVMDDLREARSLLRRLPSRRAPRNFTLTRKMVGQNPPMPRAYPAFRFVTTLATLLLFFTVGLNVLAPQMASQAPASGMGGGAGDQQLFAEPAPEAGPAAATEAPAAESPAEMAPQPTETLSTEDSLRSAESPAQKDGLSGQPEVSEEAKEAAPFVPPTWQFVLLGVIVVGALLMVLMRQSALNRWRR
ncbi:MAG TPA: hypothetical protein VFO91_09985 [Anaerolineales bacterium]|nr:hypothetical protein [Anaerolineales bacterium]